MRAFLALILTSYREFIRDRAALFWTVAFPLIFVVIFGLIFSREDGAEYDIGLVVEDQSTQAVVLGGVIEQFDVFKVTTGSRADELDALAEGERRAVLMIPAGFGASIEAGNPRPVEVHYDSSQQTTAQVVVPVLQRALEIADRVLTQTAPVIRAELHTLQSERLRSIDFVIPGILAMSVMQLGVFGSANMVSLRERRVLRRLQATPLSRATLVGSDVVFRMFLVVLQSAILIAVGRLLFGVKLLGNLPALAGVVILGVLVFLALGFLIAAFTRTEQGFMPVAQAFTMPMMFLSGIFFPVEVMPDWIRPLINVLPLTYLGDAVRQLMVGGAPLFAMWIDLTVLAGFLVVLFTAAVRFFRWD